MLCSMLIFFKIDIEIFYANMKALKHTFYRLCAHKLLVFYSVNVKAISHVLVKVTDFLPCKLNEIVCQNAIALFCTVCKLKSCEESPQEENLLFEYLKKF